MFFEVGEGQLGLHADGVQMVDFSVLWVEDLSGAEIHGGQFGVLKVVLFFR